MAKYVFSFLFTFILIFSNAQEDYKSKLSTLFKNSKTNFSKIKGNEIESENEKRYESKITLGVGEEYIEKSNDPDNQHAYYNISKYKEDESKVLEDKVLEFMEENFPSPKYVIQTEDLGYNGAYYTMYVYDTSEEDPLPLFIVELSSNIHIDTKLLIIIPGISPKK